MQKNIDLEQNELGELQHLKAKTLKSDFVFVCVIFSWITIDVQLLIVLQGGHGTFWFGSPVREIPEL